MLDDAETPTPAPTPEEPPFDPYEEEALRLGWAKSRLQQFLEEVKYEMGNQGYAAKRIAREVEGVMHSARYMLDDLPRARLCRDPLAAVVALDERFGQPALTLHDTSVARWISLKKDESYDAFKFKVGEIVKLPGWSLDHVLEDKDVGTVDYRFKHEPSGARLTLYVTPGDSEHCRIQEMTEIRSVTVKKIVCDGEVKGELAGAVLTAPMAPKPGDGNAHDEEIVI